MKRIVLTLAAIFSLVTTTVAHAQFGSGIVYDPTQSAHAFTQIENEGKSLENQAQQIENGQQIFTNTLKIASTAIQTYNTVQQQYNLYREMILAPRMLYSRFLSPTTDLRMLEQISNTYGNSMGWLNSANTGNGAAASWQQVSVPHTSNMIPGYGSASVSGQQQIAAQGATVDLGDSVMSNNLAVLGTIRANSDIEADRHRQPRSRHTKPGSEPTDGHGRTCSGSIRPCSCSCAPCRMQTKSTPISPFNRSWRRNSSRTASRLDFRTPRVYTNTYQMHVAPAYNGGAQALTY